MFFSNLTVVFVFFFSKVRLAFDHMEKRKAEGMVHEDAVNHTSIEMAQASEAHCRAFLVQSSYEMTKNIGETVSAAFAQTLHNLIELYALETVNKSLSGLLRASNFHQMHYPRF